MGHPHVDAGQVRVGALDPVAHRAHQNPPEQEIELKAMKNKERKERKKKERIKDREKERRQR